MKSVVLGVALAAVLGITIWLYPFTDKPVRDTAAAKVHIRQEKNHYQLYRDGRPYQIKGAAVTDINMLRSVKENGGNSIRVYDFRNARAWLDSAAKHGLSVVMGLPVQQQGDGMDYGNAAAVQAQQAQIKETVLRYRHHPALLMWVVGNEPTVFIEPEYRNFFRLRTVLKAIDDVAQLVHQLDPDHPAVLAHAGFFPKLLKLTGYFCPNIDIVSFNSFSAVPGFINKLQSVGWNKPFFFTEFGSRGYWSWGETAWMSRLEPSSYHKALYLQSQFESIAAGKANCLGGYVFLWGVKNEYTPTTFSLFAPGRQPLETALVDVCQKAWQGTAPECAAPGIDHLSVNNKKDKENIYLVPETLASAGISWASLPSGALQVHWELAEEKGEYLLSSYKDQKMEVILSGDLNFQQSQLHAISTAREDGHLFNFRVPAKPGPYRLFVYVTNGCQKVATANACFYVQPH